MKRITATILILAFALLGFALLSGCAAYQSSVAAREIGVGKNQISYRVEYRR